MKSLLQLFGISSDFEKIFFANEYKTLAGDSNKIILALIAILFLTFLALGYAVGSIQNLKTKMDNPFTNWVDLSIKNEYISKRARKIEKDYTSLEKKELLQLDQVRGWVMFNLEMYHQNYDPVSHSVDTLAYACWGRSLDFEDPLLQRVLSDDNLIWQSKEINLEEEALENCEIIITQEMLKRLGYDSQNPDIGHIFIREASGVIPVKIVGVIKELPRFCQFVTASKFYNILNAKRDGIKKCADLIKANDNTKSNYSFIMPSNTDVQKIKTLSNQFLKVNDPPDIRVEEKVVSGKTSWEICKFSFLPGDQPGLDSIHQFLNYCQAAGTPLGHVIQLDCRSEICTELSPEDYYYLAFNFNRLDDVRKFKDDLKAAHNVDIDMNQVEAKENFALVSRLTLAISLILLGFSVLSIILFVNNILKTHLFKVRPNLGTFKAFGLSNDFLNNTYLKIIFSFLLLSITVAFLISILVDRVEQWWMLEESQFNIFSSWVLVAFLGLVIISLIISANTIKKILGATPGDLIYQR